MTRWLTTFAAVAISAVTANTASPVTSGPQFCVTATRTESGGRENIALPGSDYRVIAAIDGAMQSIDACPLLFTTPSAESTVLLVKSKGTAPTGADAITLGHTMRIDEQYSMVALDPTVDPVAVDAYFLTHEMKTVVIYAPAAEQSMRSQFSPPSLRVENNIDGSFFFDVDATKHFLNLSLSQAEFTQLLKQLSGAMPLGGDTGGQYLSTRYSYSSENAVAADFIAAYLSGLKYRTHISRFAMVGRDAGRNIIAQCRGRTRPDEVVLVGAHFDSLSESPMQLAPGAVDDGSGAAGVMTLAHAVAQMFPDMDQTGCFDRTVVFALFGGEEQGLHGSYDFVKQHGRGDGRSGVVGAIKSAILMDMISYSRRYVGVTIEGTFDRSIQSLMKTVSSNMKQQAPELTVATSSTSFGSDHVNFQRANIPAVLLIEQDDTKYPNYHRSTDTFTDANVNLLQTMGILRGLAGSLVDLTRA